MAKGEPTNRSRWPETGPVRNLLLFLDKVREENNREGLRGITNRMVGLNSPTAVSHMLRGLRLPADQDQLTSLVRALGGGSDEVTKGQELYRKAQSAWDPHDHPPDSLYTEYVRQIAPAELLDRTAELAELAAFGTGGPTESAYLWWQAPAWAGKSALMSWFALNPPPKVDVVSFFVTARFATHNNRWAFLEAVSEQLAVLGGSGVPLPPREFREAHLTRLLEAAAATCLRRGRRLVLLVDGLDEDQGVSGGSGTYSIAALLPVRPPTGLRVVVAGRPHPPIPHDVPDGHPLRQGGVVRDLAPSLHAQVVRTTAERDLKRLLHGDPVGQDLLGLVTAAGGGLARDDLSEVTGLPGYEVEDRLHAVTGRAFTTRPTLWQRQEAASLYVLAHEELQVMAKTAFGAAGLARHRRRLRDWAESYRRREWPEDTPEYLLTGYHRMLRAAVGEAAIGAAEAEAEMLLCAADRARHDRMLDVSGGDAAAFAEIATAQDFLLGRARPDLTQMLRLSVHRNELAERNSALPDCLPAAWAVLGQPHRAEAIARSGSDGFRQTRGLVSLVEGLAEAGNRIGAQEIARGLPRPEDRDAALAALARGAARGGDLEQAERVAAGIHQPFYRATALAAVARSAAAAGEPDRATALAGAIEDTARGLPDGYRRVLVWCELAEVRASAGDGPRALAATAAAERTVRTLDERDAWHLAYARLVQSAAAVGDLPRAVRITKSFENWESRREDMLVGLAKGLAAARKYEDAQAAVDAIATPAPGTSDGKHEDVRELAETFRRIWVADATLELAVAIAAAGDHDRAVALARALPSPLSRAKVLSSLARELAFVDRARAVALAKEAENTAREDKASSTYGLAAMAEGLARAGDHEAAVGLAHRVTNRYEQLAALAVVARERGTAGDHEGGIALARMAVSQAGDITRTFSRGVVLTDLAKVLTDAGDVANAELAVRQIDDHGQRAMGLVTLAKATLQPHGTSKTLARVARRAAALAEDAERLAHRIDRDEERCQVLTALTDLAAARGDLAHAVALARRTERLARTIQDNPGDQQQARRARALLSLGAILAAHGLFDWAHKLAAAAEEIALEIHDVLFMPLELSYVAELYTTLGDHDRADAAIAAIPDPEERAKACATCIGPAAADNTPAAPGRPGSAVGPHPRDRVAALATTAETLIHELHAAHSRVEALTELAVALARAGDADRASARAADAEPLVRFLNQESAQATKLASLSDAVLPPQREHLIARALAVGSWKDVLARLASLAPDAVRAIATERFSGT
ncbi:tetratricopeptide repeat protein [Streptomyces xantholiticus]